MQGRRSPWRFYHRRSAFTAIAEQSRHTGAQHVAEFLLDLTNAKAARAPSSPYDKTLIAGWLGMQPQSLSRAFSRLEATASILWRRSRTSIPREYILEDRSTPWRKAD
jgi:hypothetical protein